MVQWTGIQGTRVLPLVREDPTSRETTQPMRHTRRHHSERPRPTAEQPLCAVTREKQRRPRTHQQINN